MIFNYVTGPAHGWLMVTKTAFNNLTPDLYVSAYSYESDLMLYLEEDCDMPRFLNALDQDEIEYQVIENIVDDESPIRNLPSYQGAAA
jgi:hypothetical protein